MQTDPHYDDVVAEVTALLADRAGRAGEAGVGEVWIDPGIGFGKTVDHNLALLGSAGRPGGHRLSGHGGDQPQELPRPRWPRPAAGTPLPVDERLPVRWPPPPGPWRQGARMVRVHDVAATVAGRGAGRAGGLRGRGRSGAPGAGQPSAADAVKGKWAAGIPPATSPGSSRTDWP